MYWYVMNDVEFGPRNTFKLKYRMGNQIIETFCRISSLQELDPLSLISKNLKTLRKLLMNHVQCIEIEWMMEDLGLEHF